MQVNKFLAKLTITFPKLFDFQSWPGSRFTGSHEPDQLHPFASTMSSSRKEGRSNSMNPSPMFLSACPLSQGIFLTEESCELFLTSFSLTLIDFVWRVAGIRCLATSCLIENMKVEVTLLHMRNRNCWLRTCETCSGRKGQHIKQWKMLLDTEQLIWM